MLALETCGGLFNRIPIKPKNVKKEARRYGRDFVKLSGPRIWTGRYLGSEPGRQYKKHQ
jgi:hypothetical protein